MYVCYVMLLLSIMLCICVGVRTWIVCQQVRIFLFVAALFHPKLKLKFMQYIKRYTQNTVDQTSPFQTRKI